MHRLNEWIEWHGADEVDTARGGCFQLLKDNLWMISWMTTLRRCTQRTSFVRGLLCKGWGTLSKSHHCQCHSPTMVFLECIDKEEVVFFESAQGLLFLRRCCWARPSSRGALVCTSVVGHWSNNELADAVILWLPCNVQLNWLLFFQLFLRLARTIWEPIGSSNALACSSKRCVTPNSVQDTGNLKTRTQRTCVMLR